MAKVRISESLPYALALLGVVTMQVGKHLHKGGMHALPLMKVVPPSLAGLVSFCTFCFFPRVSLGPHLASPPPRAIASETD